MIQVFLLGGELVRPLVAHNLMQLIAEGFSFSILLPVFSILFLVILQERKTKKQMQAYECTQSARFTQCYRAKERLQVVSDWLRKSAYRMYSFTLGPGYCPNMLISLIRILFRKSCPFYPTL